MPKIVFIPGFGGSVLTLADGRVAYGSQAVSIAGGAVTLETGITSALQVPIEELWLEDDGSSMKPVRASAIVGAPYYDKCLFGLSLLGDVITLPWDWRLDPRKEAARLLALMPDDEFYLIAHSMGGMVAALVLKMMREEHSLDAVKHFVRIASPVGGEFATLPELCYFGFPNRETAFTAALATGIGIERIWKAVVTLGPILGTLAYRLNPTAQERLDEILNRCIALFCLLPEFARNYDYLTASITTGLSTKEWGPGKTGVQPAALTAARAAAAEIAAAQRELGNPAVEDYLPGSKITSIYSVGIPTIQAMYPGMVGGRPGGKDLPKSIQQTAGPLVPRCPQAYLVNKDGDGRVRGNNATLGPELKNHILECDHTVIPNHPTTIKIIAEIVAAVEHSQPAADIVVPLLKQSEVNVPLPAVAQLVPDVKPLNQAVPFALTSGNDDTKYTKGCPPKPLQQPSKIEASGNKQKWMLPLMVK